MAKTMFRARKAGGRFPYRVSPNGRYLVDALGTPVRLNSDPAWFIPFNGAPSELRTYFADCKDKGFNATNLMAICHPGATWGGGTSTAPTAPKCSVAGGDVYPFTTCVNQSSVGNTNFDEPIEAYWSWIKKIVDTAEEYGVLVFFYFAYTSIPGQGWNSAMAEAHNTASDYAAMTAYGVYLGTKFASNKNIVWAIAGDPSGLTGWETAHTRVLNGILSARPGSTMWSGEGNANDGLTSELSGFSSPSFNAQYGAGASTTAGDKFAFMKSQEAYASPGLALYLTEPNYSGDFGATDATVRPELYGSTLAGALCGCNSGEAAIWGWSASWQSALNAQSRLQRKYVNDFFTSFAWHTMVPVLNAGGGGTDFVSSGGGSYPTTAYKQRAISAAGDLGVIYFPEAGTTSVVLDMTKFSAGRMKCRWFDPTAGTFRQDGIYPNTGTRTFTTPGSNSQAGTDWVLLLTAL